VIRRPVRIALALLALVCAGCAKDEGPSDVDPAAQRSYRMGFAALPPRPDMDIAIRTLELWTQRADLAIVHEELPWTELMSGVSPDAILDRDKQGLIDYWRGKGLQLVFVADLTDGLSRGEEPPQLRALGRSITELEVQQKFQDYVDRFVRRFHPEYVALSAETNLVRFAAPATIYDAMVATANREATSLASLSDPPLLFITVQVDVAWGRLIGDNRYTGIEQDFTDFPFTAMIGLSSYPYFGWTDPSDLPDDYYSRLLNGRAMPVLVSEGGWSSTSFPGVASSPARQADYIRKQARMLDRVDAKGWVQLTFTDLDLPTFPSDVQQSLIPFASLGLVDADLQPKPALAVWDSLFTRPLR
jgi:hypothetical protein